MPPQIVIPPELLPADGRFGSGPSKVRSAAVDALAAAAPRLLGTSHRRPAVTDLVGRLREGLAAHFRLPAGYEVALGCGGASLLWDAIPFALVRERAAHAVFGEFSAKAAAASRAAPFVQDPLILQAEPGSAPALVVDPSVDLYHHTHNETSTGVMVPLARPAGTEGLVVVDGTSAAGAAPLDPAAVDAYYFSPQKVFASDGGLWLALLSPAAIARLDEVAATGRHVPAILDVRLALEQSRKHQTLNTPAVATLFLMVDQLEWLAERGGLDAAVADCRAKAGHLYRWATERPWAVPFVTDEALRSTVVCTIDLDRAVVAADDVTAVLRAHRIVDIEAYRKLGRNQLRIGVFPAVDAADVAALTACIDHVVERLA